MERITHTMRREYWKTIIKECNESGMKKKDWLEIHNVNPKLFYRWQQKLRMEIGAELTLSQNFPSDVPQFNLLTPPEDTAEVRAVSTTVIHMKDISVEISEEMSDAFLFRILKVITHV